MEETSSLIMTQQDHQKLSVLIQRADSEIASLLEQELDRAIVVPKEKLPSDVVAMNSKVKFEDLDTGKESVVTLVYPQEANIQEGRVSILAPVGAALIGLRVGQTIHWPLPNGKEKKLRVTSVIGQSESAGEERRTG